MAQEPSSPQREEVSGLSGDGPGGRMPLDRPRLYLNRITERDCLVALEFGRVDDGQPSENWDGVSDSFGYLHDGPEGRCLGFEVIGLTGFDADDPDVARIWRGPRFDSPQLGLTDVPAGEVVVGAQAFFGDGESVNRFFFETACRARGEEALAYWRACLEAGDAMAHFALGYTLYELGRFREAYRHLRYYSEIAPAGSWNWCWFGKAAEALGEIGEARAAYSRALELEREGDEETDAAERLARIEHIDDHGRVDENR